MTHKTNLLSLKTFADNAKDLEFRIRKALNAIRSIIAMSNDPDEMGLLGYIADKLEIQANVHNAEIRRIFKILGKEGSIIFQDLPKTLGDDGLITINLLKPVK